MICSLSLINGTLDTKLFFNTATSSKLNLNQRYIFEFFLKFSVKSSWRTYLKWVLQMQPMQGKCKPVELHRASVRLVIFEIIDFVDVLAVENLACWISRICSVFRTLFCITTLPASVLNEPSNSRACIESFSRRAISSANAKSLTW